MRTMRVLACLLLLTCTSAHLLAGSVLRVGPGRAFATIQAAVDASRDGDLVLVDPGTYPGFVIAGRALSILPGGVGTITLQAAPGQPAVTVRGTMAGQDVTLSSLRIAYAEPGAPAIVISANTGSVRFSDLDVELAADLVGVAHQAAVEISDSATVWFLAMRVASALVRRGSTRNLIGPNDGLSAVAVARSQVVIRRFVLRGYATPAGARYGGDALRLREQSAMWLLQDPAGTSFLTGGDGGDFGGNCAHFIGAGPLPPVEMCGFRLFTPGAGRLRRGGYYAHNDDGGIVNQGGSTFERILGACVDLAAGFTTIAPLRVAPGATLDVDISAAYFARVQLTYLSVGARMLAVGSPGIQGYVLFDPAGATLIDARFVNGPTRLQFALPPVSALIGLQLTAQAALGPPGGATSPVLSLTFPAMVVVAP